MQHYFLNTVVGFHFSTQPTDLPPVERLFSTLSNPWVHSQLKVLAGYDTSQTGDVIATIEEDSTDRQSSR
jgi:hypothetical protein